MSLGLALILIALAFSCVLPAFSYAARQKGWPQGEIFVEQKIPTLVGLACLAWLVTKVVIASVLGSASILWLLWAALAYFVGGPLVLAVLGRWSGMVALVLAPALSVATFFVRA